MAGSAVPPTEGKPRSTFVKRATVYLLIIWLITLIIEVPFGASIIVQQQGVFAAVGPVIIEAVFMILIVVFVVFGRRGRNWSFAGAVVIGILHTILSAAIYQPWTSDPSKPPQVLAVWLTAIPALVAITAGASFFALRKQKAML